MRRGWNPSIQFSGFCVAIAMVPAALFGCASSTPIAPANHLTALRDDDQCSWPVIVVTPLVIVCSDGSQEDAERHARWMERTIEEFDRFTRSAGWPTIPLDEPLTAMLFSQQRDLQAFASRHDRVHIGAASGYYSPHNDWVVMNVGEPSLVSVHHDDSRCLPPDVGSLAKPQAALALRSDEPEGVSQHGSPAARCVHETIHQLMFRSGLMDQRVTYPLWIAEGLATAFETDDPLEAEQFGPDADHAPRVAGFDRMVAENRVIPLRELITVTSLPRDSIDMHDFYNQSYALTTWLCRERPGEVLAYLRLLNEGDARRRSGRQQVALFEEAFGSIESLQSEWLATIRIE